MAAIAVRISRHPDNGWPDSLSTIAKIIEKLKAGAAVGTDSAAFNKMLIRWRKPKIPYMRDLVTIEPSDRNHPYLNLPAPSHNSPPITPTDTPSENM